MELLIFLLMLNKTVTRFEPKSIISTVAGKLI